MLLVLCGLVGLRPTPAAARDTPWAKVTEIAPGRPEVIGSYAGGCIVGAEALPEAGDGFESIRRWRNRHFGHPDTVAFVRRFSQKLAAVMPGPSVLVGDLSQIRGGLMASGHRSHQLGLDADFWFTHPEGDVDSDDKFVSMVDERSEKAIPAHLGDRQLAMLRIAAEDPAVARIFVHWGIKAHLCRTVGKDRAWLHKIRAWYGHDRHFHVRLACPPGSPDCRNQSRLSAGDACGEEAWFSRAEVAKRKKPKKVAKRPAKPPKKDPAVAKKTPKRVRSPRPGFPERCYAVLAAAPGGIEVPPPSTGKLVAKCKARGGRKGECGAGKATVRERKRAKKGGRAKTRPSERKRLKARKRSKRRKK